MLRHKSFVRLATMIALSGAMFATFTSRTLAQMVANEGGFLDPGTSAEHYFQGQAGQNIDISLQSADFDTYVTVYGPNGQLLGENDDSDGTLNSRVSLRLPRSGSYRVVVEGYDVEQRGRYRLSVNTRTAAQPSPQPQPSLAPQPVQVLGEQGFLQSGRYVEHYFQGQAGQTVNISLESRDFDTYLAVYGPNNRLVGENDDDGGTLNSRLTMTLPSSGQYRLLVQGYTPDDTGRYMVSVSR